MNQLNMIRGDERTFTFDDLMDAEGDAINLGAAAVTFVIDDQLELTEGDGVTVDESSGQVAVTVLEDELPDYHDRRRKYRWALRVVVGGARFTARRGWLNVLPDVEAP